MMSRRLSRPVPNQAIATLLTFTLLAASLISASATADRVYALAGDWNGDGKSALGWYADGVLHLQGAGQDGQDLSFAYGRPGDVPVAGDFNGDGRDTVGIVRKGRHWHLKNSLTGGPADLVFTYGSRFSREIPIVGDWNRNGVDTVGVIRGNTWLLRNSNSGGSADITFSFGRIDRGDVPMVGDWLGLGRDTPGVVRRGVWYLSHDFSGGSADQKIFYGRNDDTPLAGKWGGKDGDSPGVLRGTTLLFRNTLTSGVADDKLNFSAPGSTGNVDTKSAKTTTTTTAPAKPSPKEDTTTTAPAEPSPKDDATEAPTRQDPPKSSGEPDESELDDPEGPSETTKTEEPEPPAAEPATSRRSSVGHGTELKVGDVGLTNESALTRVSGPVTSTHDGQVIENVFVTVSGRGAVAIQVNHSNVTIRNCRVRYQNMANGIMVAAGLTGIVVENCVIEDDIATGPYDDRQSNPQHSQNIGGSIGMSVRSPALIRRNYMAGHRSAMALHGDNITVRENYLAHNFNGVTRPASWQKGSGITYRGGSSGNVVIERNYINLNGSRSAALNLYPNNPIRNVTVRDNHINGNGGGWGINGGDSTHGSREQNRDIRITGNRFSGDFQWPNVLGEGTNAGVNMNRPGAVWNNNRWVGSTQDLPPRCGIRQDACH